VGKEKEERGERGERGERERERIRASIINQTMSEAKRKALTNDEEGQPARKEAKQKQPSSSSSSSTTTTTTTSSSSSASASSSSSAKTPKQRLDERVDAALEKYKAEGSVMIVGIQRDRNDSDDDDDDDDDDEEAFENNLTEEQLSTFRCVLITKRRETYLEKMNDLVLGDQANDSFRMFNTSFSTQLMIKVPKAVRAAAQHPTKAETFDHLLALTLQLLENNYWMSDFEVDKDLNNYIVKPLGAAWKKLLHENTNEQLGIDPEFTRPGVEAMLEKFAKELKEATEDMELDVDLTFHWQ